VEIGFWTADWQQRQYYRGEVHSSFTCLLCPIVFFKQIAQLSLGFSIHPYEGFFNPVINHSSKPVKERAFVNIITLSPLTMGCSPHYHPDMLSFGRVVVGMALGSHSDVLSGLEYVSCLPTYQVVVAPTHCQLGDDVYPQSHDHHYFDEEINYFFCHPYIVPGLFTPMSANPH